MKNLFLAISVFVACVIPGVGYANDVIVKGLVMGSKDISQMPACTSNGRDFPCIASRQSRNKIDISRHHGGDPDLEVAFDRWARLLSSIARAAKLPAGICSGSRHPSVMALSQCKNLFMEDVNVDIEILKNWFMVQSDMDYNPVYGDRKNDFSDDLRTKVIPYYMYRNFRGDPNAPYFFVAAEAGKISAIMYFATKSRINHADMISRYGNPVGVYLNYWATPSNSYSYSERVGVIVGGINSVDVYARRNMEVSANLHPYNVVMFKSGIVNIEYGCPLSDVISRGGDDDIVCYVNAFLDDVVDEYKKAFSENLKELEKIKAKNEEINKINKLMNKYRSN